MVLLHTRNQIKAALFDAARAGRPKVAGAQRAASPARPNPSAPTKYRADWQESPARAGLVGWFCGMGQGRWACGGEG